MDILRSPERLSDFITQNPYLYGMPLLFPPNRISGAEFGFENRVYRFPVNEPNTGCFVHGTMHETAFVVSETEQTRIKLCYEATEKQPYLTFPHQFLITIEYCLRDEKLVQSVSVRNKSNENMPVGLGFHTTFNTVGSGLVRVFADVKKEFFRNEKYLPTGACSESTKVLNELSGADGYDAEKELSALFELGENHLISLQRDDFRVNYILDPKYKYLMIFNTASKGEYVCIEPQTWISNCPNFENRNKYGFSWVKPHEEVTYTSEIFVDSVKNWEK